jgi:hypothetical protein
MKEHDQGYEYRRIATTGCEVLTANGQVIGWTIDEHWAAVIVQALNVNSPPSPQGDGGLLPSKDLHQRYRPEAQVQR